MSIPELATAARAFAQSGLWLSFPQESLFAVRFSDGETGYCLAMGGEGIAPTLMVYPGDGALASYYRLRTLPSGAPPYRLHEAVARQQGLQCTVKASGPVCFRHAPYMRPSTALDAAELLRLSEALYGAAALAAVPGEDRPKPAPCLHTRATPGGAPAFNITAITLPEDVRYEMDSPVLDGDVARALRAVPVNDEQALEAELTIGPEPDADADAPGYPVGLLLVDPDEGIVAMPVVQSFAEDYTELVAALLSFCMEHGRPREVAVREDATYLLLQNSLRQLDIPLVARDDLPALDALKAEFYEGIAHDTPIEEENR